MTTGAPSSEIDSLGTTGNWSAYVTKTSGTTDLSQTRTSNKVNEITAIGGTPGWATPPAYDAAGNMTSFPQPASPSSNFTATYDAWNRMVKISSGGSTVATYQYDGRGRRIVKVTAAVSETRHFYYTNNWQNIEERTGTSTAMDKQYVWGVRYIDELVCRDDATPQRLYATQDANFNVTSIGNTSGLVVERFFYELYGDSAVMTLAWTDIADDYAWCIRFTGHLLDIESEIYYLRSRYYHPSLGKFVERDAIGYADGISLYQYVSSSPVTFTDLFGFKKAAGKHHQGNRGKGDADPKKKRDCDKKCPPGSEKTVVIIGDVEGHGAGLYVGGWVSEEMWRKRYDEYVAQAIANGEDVTGYSNGVSMAQMQDIVQDPCTKKLMFIGHSSQDQGVAPLPGIWINPNDFLQPSDVKEWRNNCDGPTDVTLRSCNQGMGPNRTDWGDAWGVPQDHLRVPDYYEHWYYISDPPVGNVK